MLVGPAPRLTSVAPDESVAAGVGFVVALVVFEPEIT
jgi:hypothetical protein